MSSYRFGGRVLLGISVVASSWVLACERQPPPAATGEHPPTDAIVLELAEGATLEGIFNAPAGELKVRACASGEAGCIACDQSDEYGLVVQDKTRVRCGGANGKFCSDGGARFRWVFEKSDYLDEKKEYHAVVRYTNAAGKLSGTQAYPKTYCRDASGQPSECEDSGPRKRLVVHSGMPELDGAAGGLRAAHWPYRIDLYEIGADDSETLVACADPEIIVDPPRGGTVVPPGGSGS